MPHYSEQIKPVPSAKKNMIDPISENAEKLLKQQLNGDEFVLLEITKKCGNKVFLRSNNCEAVKMKNALPKKRISLNGVQNKTTVKYSGSPNCEIIYVDGDQLVVNLDGGPIEDCYE